MEAYQTEFANMTNQAAEGTTEQSAVPAQSQAPQTAEEVIELALGQQTFKIPVSTELPLKHNGTIQKVPFSKILNRYREIDNWESKVNDHKRERQQFEQERGDLNTYNANRHKFEALQKWSEENPDQWESLKTLWENRDQALKQGGEQAALLSEINSLRQSLKEMQDFKSSVEQEREAQQTQKDIELVQGQIEGFKKDFPEIDLDEKGQDGLTVREHIISFGVQNGFRDFESAALKYLKPRLVDTIAARGRNDMVKGVVRDKKEGIVSRGRTLGTTGQSAKSIDPKKMSYEDLNDAAKAEFDSIVGTST